MKLLQKPRQSIIVAEEDNRPIAPYSSQIPAAPRKSSMSNMLIVLVVLLALTALGFLGPDVSYLGSLVLAAVPGVAAALIVHRAFRNFWAACFGGLFVEMIAIHYGVVDNALTGGYELFMTVSRISGFAAALILAVIIGMAVAGKK